MDGAGGQTAGSLVEEEWGVGRAGPHLQPLVQVLLQRPAGGSAQGYPTSLSKLAFGDVEALLGAVEVLEIQGQGLANPDPRAVESPQKRLVGVRPKRVRRRQFAGGRQERLKLRGTVNIRRVSPG